MTIFNRPPWPTMYCKTRPYSPSCKACHASRYLGVTSRSFHASHSETWRKCKADARMTLLPAGSHLEATHKEASSSESTITIFTIYFPYSVSPIFIVPQRMIHHEPQRCSTTANNARLTGLFSFHHGDADFHDMVTSRGP